MNRHLVSVYGTLRQGGEHAMTKLFPDSKFIGRANVSGRLYDLGEYPCLLADEASSPVVGEVYEIDDAILKKLDDYEAESNYRRRQVEATVGNHQMMCWIYEPEPEFYSLHTLIESGDWIEYAKTKSEMG